MMNSNVTKKMTKADYFRQIKANYDLTVEEIAFIDHELELLARKNSSEKKPSANQIANQEIKETILNGMEEGRKYTITEVIKEVEGCQDLSNQKVSALMKQLLNDGLVEKTEEKRKSYFSKVA